ncbi:MAG: hypothetical protein IKS51_00410 [Erysipelotrichaceae bacterium]|nr:hypothetical protein [Erysipelotrichaceae bacterium]
MIEANSSFISEDNKELLDKLGISYEPLHNSKKNKLAFTTDNHRKREFEIKFMSDGTYRIGTRYLGYRGVMSKADKPVTKRKDPDGRRYSFYITVCENELNTILMVMLLNGFDPIPKTESI